MSDRASKALAEASLPGEPRTYDATSKRSRVPLTTLYHCHHRRRLKEAKAQSQQYLTPPEEKALEKYLKLIANLRNLNYTNQVSTVPRFYYRLPAFHDAESD
jgi:hypothetical protein